MCYAVAAAVVTIAATGYSVAENEDQKRKQRNFRLRQEKLARENAAKQAQLQAQELAAQHAESVAESIAELSAVQKRSEAAISTAQTIAGEIGGEGSLAALIGQFTIEQEEYEVLANANIQRTREAFLRGIKGVGLGAAARSNSARQAPRGPTGYGQIGQSIGNAIGQYGRAGT